MVTPTDPPEVHFGSNGTCMFCGKRVKPPRILCTQCHLALIDEEDDEVVEVPT